MKRKIGKKLLKKYLSGKSSEKENRIIEDWYAYRTIVASEDYGTEDYARIKSEIWEALESKSLRSGTSRFKWLPYAAALILTLTFAGMYLYRTSSKIYSVQNYSGTPINPGKAGATLTLSDGTRIDLSEANVGQLTTESGVIVSKSAEGSLVYRFEKPSRESANTKNTLSTAKGETYQLVLPDGSKIWLNSASSISFSSTIGHGSIRKVSLEGEGYFEIAKSKIPFVVETASQKVEVLGTHFNIEAYKSGEAVVKTTLIEGRVKVLSNGESSILSPGQQAVSKTGRLSIHEEDLETVLAWKNGFFKFDGNLVDVMETLSRWYDVKVDYRADVPKELSLWGYVSRSNDLVSILSQLERTNKIRFEIQGRKVTVLPH
ncbi:FecR family protein [Sphingobacterium tabacisoli]|uniref:FecR family protein n=1 Tax=Sphingobacterium tabacisoli TaxID=2044855 RepID=A0ABW5L6W6_9SPHI|nr:FecR family protein [Sphingobacterium tabacisoli]